MGTNNIGLQIRTFYFGQPGKSKEFNKINYKITYSGLYKGGRLNWVNNSQFLLEPFIAQVNDNAEELCIRIETTESISLSTNISFPYVVIEYSWSDQSGIYADITLKNENEIQSDTIIIGKCLFDDSNNLLKYFDYSMRKEYNANSLNELLISDNLTCDSLPYESSLWELNTPNAISSNGVSPTDKIIDYLHPLIKMGGVYTHKHDKVKWLNRGCVGLFYEMNNLLTYTENLTEWTKANVDTDLTDIFIDDKQMTLVTGLGSSYQSVTHNISATPGTAVGFQCYLKKGTEAQPSIKIIEAADRLHIQVDWNTLSVTIPVGTNLQYRFLDNQTVWVAGVSDIIPSANSDVFLYANSAAGIFSTYFGGIQIEDKPMVSPYIKSTATQGVRPASKLSYLYQLPLDGTIEIWVRPYFGYSTSNAYKVVSDYVGITEKFAIVYDPGQDTWKAIWNDGVTQVELLGSAYSSNVDFQKWTHLRATWNTITDLYKFYINGLLVDENNITPLGIDENNPFNRYLSVGSAPRADTPPNLQLNGLVSDLMIKNEYDDVDFEAHHLLNVPYKGEGRLLGKNCNFWIDEYGNAWFKNML